MILKTGIVSFLFLITSSTFFKTWAQPAQRHNLQFEKLATRWDEAIPLGNGMLGALVWQKQGRLRLSLDRADLWDERKALDLSGFNFKWVTQQVLKKDYAPVQKLGDRPYDATPYPTKLPAAAMEFDISSLGSVVSNVLDISTGLNTVRFKNGLVFKCYIHATDNVGYFSFENIPSTINASTSLMPRLIVHNYNSGKINRENDNSHAGEGLEKLGYAKGTVTKTAQFIHYRQPTYDGHFYEVKIQWKKFSKDRIIGSWAIESDKPASLPALNTLSKEPTAWPSHQQWWKRYWAQSSISLPDSLIEKQYYLEMYKLGAASRPTAPAITLQAVWTADNGSLPPWKGDFHNDLNTQLSYWPAYTGNRLKEGESYINWLWNQRAKNKAYTKHYFGVEGLNTPGVATLSGDPMGGWIQYSLSPTVGAWCAQHFYWQWKYGMDDAFLKTKAYPYIHDVATYIENITRMENGKRRLPLSSSPEYNDNNINAWFLDWTNFDLALVKFLFDAASDVAVAMNKKTEAAHWQQISKQLPDFATGSGGLMVAPGENNSASHRHLSPYMAIYPMALLDVNNEKDKPIIDRSLTQIEKLGTRAWCGYSFSWMASLYARAYKADKAAQQLRIFASNFCSPNSFHLNGDQKGGEYSGFTYRPFTLEGNFAFAQGVHELLLQSRKGYIEVFPAVPKDWNDVSFQNLRTEGAFVISGRKENGVPSSVKVFSEKGGLLKIKLPFKTWLSRSVPRSSFNLSEKGIISIMMKKGQTIIIENGYE
ncbi:glycosyl hydrolase family 95 catalytic domain-containing protein [Niabella insulamsoli]|uniref:glycosyl hydrolase family 95 catalytic domain-containing protein n=1 Tax=Niabella insulamsoli TaxID=3144874 RepID=UPI0031FBC759